MLNDIKLFSDSVVEDVLEELAGRGLTIKEERINSDAVFHHKISFYAKQAERGLGEGRSERVVSKELVNNLTDLVYGKVYPISRALVFNEYSFAKPYLFAYLKNPVLICKDGAFKYAKAVAIEMDKDEIKQINLYTYTNLRDLYDSEVGELEPLNTFCKSIATPVKMALERYIFNDDSGFEFGDTVVTPDIVR